MATKKRETKAQKEQREIAELTKRINDIYSGANSNEWDDEQELPTAEILAMVVPAIRDIFKSDDVPDYVWDARNLCRFEQPSKIAEQLHAFGVRA